MSYTAPLNEEGRAAFLAACPASLDATGPPQPSSTTDALAALGLSGLMSCSVSGPPPAVSSPSLMASGEGGATSPLPGATGSGLRSGSGDSSRGGLPTAVVIALGTLGGVVVAAALVLAVVSIRKRRRERMEGTVSNSEVEPIGGGPWPAPSPEPSFLVSTEGSTVNAVPGVCMGAAEHSRSFGRVLPYGTAVRCPLPRTVFRRKRGSTMPCFHALRQVPPSPTPSRGGALASRLSSPGLAALPPPPAATTAFHTSPHGPYSRDLSKGGGAAGGLARGAGAGGPGAGAGGLAGVPGAAGRLVRSGRSWRGTRILPISDPGVGPGNGSGLGQLQIQVQGNEDSQLGTDDPRVGWQAPGAGAAAAMVGQVRKHRHTVSGSEPSVARRSGDDGWYGKGAAGTAAAVQQGAQGLAAWDGGVTNVAPSRRSLRGWLSSGGIRRSVRVVPEPGPGGRTVSDSGAVAQGSVTLGPAWRGAASIGSVGQSGSTSGGGDGGGVAGEVPTHGRSGEDRSPRTVDGVSPVLVRPRGFSAGGHASARWRAEDTCPGADASYGVLRHARSWTQRAGADGDGGAGGDGGQNGGPWERAVPRVAELEGSAGGGAALGGVAGLGRKRYVVEAGMVHGRGSSDRGGRVGAGDGGGGEAGGGRVAAWVEGPKAAPATLRQ